MTDWQAQIMEEQLTGRGPSFAFGSDSLQAFRRVFPRPTPFVRTVVRLQDLGFSADDARFAAGQASQRLPENVLFAELLEAALTVLDEYKTMTLEGRHAA